MIIALKHLHITCALLTVIGFCLRGYWMMLNPSMMSRKWVRIVPHIIDTLLLGSAIGMLISYPLLPWQHPWLVAKITALFAYISLGMVAFKCRKPWAFFAALGTISYIIAVALSKSPTLGLI